MNQNIDNGIVLHDFTGEQIYHFSELIPISASECKTIHKQPDQRQTLKTDYLNAFDKALTAIKNKDLSKVILSRIKSIPTRKSALSIFNSLNENYKSTFNYVISSAETGTWIGASPESLLDVKGKEISTMSLAGTKTNEQEWTDKEKDEQNYVTQFILSELKNTFCHDIEHSKPITVNAGPVQHLQTKIKAKLSDKHDWAKLLNALHPTPAVCGIPTQKAKSFISEIENHDRKFYTGYISILTGNSKKFFVNLRCMELFKDEAQLYLGGGLTGQSLADSEWQETERKAQTLATHI